MDIAMNAQQIRKLREARAWSQEHLAEAAGLSLRTIQRVEAEGKASPETRLALAAALEVSVTELSAPEAGAPAATAEVTPSGWRMSWQHYRLLRVVLILSALLALDLYQNAALTWSRWPLLGALLLIGLRTLRRHYVAPRPPR